MYYEFSVEVEEWDGRRRTYVQPVNADVEVMDEDERLVDSTPQTMGVTLSPRGFVKPASTRRCFPTMGLA